MHDEDILQERLMEQLYEGVLTDEGWSEALRTVSEVTRSPQASVIVYDEQSQAVAISETFGMPEETLRAYNEHYNLLDEARPLVKSIAPGGWYFDRRDLGERAMQRSAFYQDFFLHHDIASTLCNRLLTEGSVGAYLSLQRSPGQPNFDDREIAGFTRFIPHVQRAVRIRTHLRRLADRAGLASMALDRLRVPLLVLDEQRRILLANAEAEALLQRSPNLQVRHGCLHAQGLRAGQLEQLLHTACGQTGPAIADGALIVDAWGRPTLQLLVLPLPVRLQTFNRWARPLALALLQDPNQPQTVQQHLLQQLYGLTPAESRIAQALGQGDTLGQAAQRLGVSLGTVRTQVKAVFAKTGIHRQADLVRLLSALLIVG